MGKRGRIPANKLPTTSSPCEVAKPTKADMERERRWKAEDALRTLNQAETIRGDKQLMSDVKSLAKEQMDKHSYILGFRSR